MSPWKELITPDDIEVVSPSGEVRCRVKGYYSGEQFIVDDMKADIQPGDEIRRALPNGKDEVFTVEDPKLYRGGPFGSHYQIAISRRGSFEHKTGGHYQIHLSGQNARVNIASTDNSTNTANHSQLFTEIREAIDKGVSDTAQRGSIKEHLTEIERAKTKTSFIKAYQELIATAADHITVLSPFLPAITALMIGLS
jgi:hypothetical protein